MFDTVLDNSSVAALFALLIAVCCAIKSRNIVRHKVWCTKNNPNGKALYNWSKELCGPAAYLPRRRFLLV